jgi:hypothetical protein
MKRTRFAGAGIVAVGLVAGLLSTVVADDKKADVTGTWKWTVERNGNTIETTLKLKQDGEKLTGTMSGRQGSPDIEIEDGKVAGDAVSFKVTRMFGENKIVMKYQGKLSDDSIKGDTKFERDGEEQSREWEAKRDKK